MEDEHTNHPVSIAARRLAFALNNKNSYWDSRDGIGEMQKAITKLAFAIVDEVHWRITHE